MRKKRRERIRKKALKDKNKEESCEYKKQLSSLEKPKTSSKPDTANTRLLKMLDTPDSRKELVKKALFARLLRSNCKNIILRKEHRKTNMLFVK